MILRDIFSSLGGIDHPEDLIIKHGSIGAELVIKELTSLTKNTKNMSN